MKLILYSIFKRENLNKKFAKTSDSVKEKNLKILICSPSNGGCDEIARRLIKIENLKIVRAGKDEKTRDCERINLNFLAQNKYQESLINEKIKNSDSLLNQIKEFDTKENLFKRRIKDTENDLEVYIYI